MTQGVYSVYRSTVYFFGSLPPDVDTYASLLYYNNFVVYLTLMSINCKKSVQFDHGRYNILTFVSETCNNNSGLNSLIATHFFYTFPLGLNVHFCTPTFLSSPSSCTKTRHEKC